MPYQLHLSGSTRGHCKKEPIMGSVALSTTNDSLLLDVRAVASMLSCSTRHVYRMADVGRIPRPVHLGAAVRWSREALIDWIGSGCKKDRCSDTNNGP
ncbi:MAG: helix-turn-helix domain-containing protein [Planctomycetales bacterium]|nr:helix-turn-helix domain-containing protein [Planctomycetales bacterium]